MDYIPIKREKKLSFINKKKKKIEKEKEPFNKPVSQLHDEKLKYFNDLYNTKLKDLKKNYNSTKSICEKEKIKKSIDDIENRIEESFYYYDNYDILKRYSEAKTDEEKTKATIDYYQKNNLEYKEEKSLVNMEFYICSVCNVPLEQNEIEETACPRCGKVYGSNISEQPTYNEIIEGSYVLSKKVLYKRETYFIELLKTIQTNKSSDFPRDLIPKVKEQLQINNIMNSNEINPVLIKGILKKLNYSKYYDGIQSIICIINKEKPLNIPKPVEEILKHMFIVIQDPWEKCKQKDRHSFFSYPYVLYKFFQILELTEYLPYIILLKSREKLIKHELLWEEIMNYIVKNNIDNNFYFKINWRYIPII